MDIYAVSSPLRSGWRWRIVSYAGETIEESQATFATIALAVADGAHRLRELDGTDHSRPLDPYRRGSTSHLRSR